MAVNTTVLAAPPERVFAVLEDARALSYFVVGTRTVRRFDPRWPDRHTVVHHTVGIGPLAVRDSTEVTDVDPPRRLVLEARIRPLGTFIVDFTLRPHAEGTELTVDEHPVSGLAAVGGLAPILDALIKVRNVEMGRRLRRLLASREEQRLRVEASA